MSAYMVDRTHIDRLVELAIDGPASGYWTRPFRYYDWARRASMQVDHTNADEVGQMLAAENARSLRARYEDADASGMVPPWADSGYVWHRPRTPKPSAVEALKGIDNYEYQACEAHDWHHTEAANFCEYLRGSLIHCLPGYEAAPWGWHDA